tara:strand:+ start:13717 stop:14658 length:942 start_codon:yes stop_codon:yes gene_type:complete
MKPLVSILIPVYNRETIIAETLESAVLQTYDNIEVIVVDNASSDGTWKVIQYFVEKDKRIKAFRNETNLGPVRNWLRCVEEAKGDFGKILWSDDLIEADFLQKTLPLFNHDVGFVYTGTQIFIGNNPNSGVSCYFLASTGVYNSSEYLHKALYDKDVPVSPGCAIFRMQDIRKNLLLDIPNKINSDFSMHAIGNDLLLFLLTANNYSFFGHVAEPLSYFRAHSGSISVSSSNGKLPLHYALAKSYFVENYLPYEVNNLAARIQIMLWKYRDSKNYNMKKVSDFFNFKVVISKRMIFKFFLVKVVKIVKSYIAK